MASPKGGAGATGTRTQTPQRQGILSRIRGGVANVVNRIRGNAG